MRPSTLFEIAVRAAEYEKAKEVVGIQIELGEENLPSMEEIQSVMELPEGREIPEDGNAQGNWDSANWNPEDAIIEVWSGRDTGTASDKHWIIELALRENWILFRADDQEDGTRHLFVRPEDESRTKEIVREVVDAAPPE